MTTRTEQIQMGRRYTWLPDGTPPSYPIEVTDILGGLEDHNMVHFDVLMSAGYDDAGNLLITRSPRMTNVLTFKQEMTPDFADTMKKAIPMILIIIALAAGYILLRR